MRLRWLLLAVVTMSLMPSLASARSRVKGFDKPVVYPNKPVYSIGAAVMEHTHRLVIAFYNPGETAIEIPVRVVADTVQYDWLTVELTNGTISKPIKFAGDRDRSRVETARIEPKAFHYEWIDLSPYTGELATGDYEVRIWWNELYATTTLASNNPPPALRCGLTYESYRYNLPPKPEPASKWPYVLGGLGFVALFVAMLLQKRAGTAYERVPSSLL